MNTEETAADDEQRAYESRLQRRLQILRDQIELGKVHVAEGLGVIESLRRVRFFEDGTADLSTVDGLVRSMALGVEVFHDRDQMKSAASLAEIQNLYFELIDKNFRSFFEIMERRGMTPHEAGMAASNSQAGIKEIVAQIPRFLEFLHTFWDDLGEIAWIHVEDMHESLKGVFGGDLFPAHNENLASKCGLYTDTLILPDPFLRCRSLFSVWPEKTQAYYFMKHAMNILQYRDLACASLETPIVVILPDRSAIEQHEMDFVTKLGKQDAIPHAQKVFGRSFGNFEELIEFSTQLATVDQVVEAVADEERLLFDSSWTGTLGEKIQRAIASQNYELLGTKSAGLIFAHMTAGRMGTSNELLIKAQRLRGTPVIDAPTSWKWFCWKLEYDAERSRNTDSIESIHIIKGLQSLASSDMEWLGKIPPKALIEVRTLGALDEIRSVLAKGIKELSEVNPHGFHRSADKIFDNVHAAFAEHQKKIAELSAKKWKFAGSDIGSWLVVGSLGVAAAATGQPVWGLAAFAADQLLDSPKLKELPKSLQSLVDESRKLKSSPVGLLFNYSHSN